MNLKKFNYFFNQHLSQIKQPQFRHFNPVAFGWQFLQLSHDFRPPSGGPLAALLFVSSLKRKELLKKENIIDQLHFFPTRIT
jgi:hypothetical protein